MAAVSESPSGELWHGRTTDGGGLLAEYDATCRRIRAHERAYGRMMFWLGIGVGAWSMYLLGLLTP